MSLSATETRPVKANKAVSLGIVTLVGVAIIIIVAFGIFLSGAVPSTQVLTLQSTESIPSNFSITGAIPYLVVSPQNHTFVLTYAVTAYNYTLNLSYDQAYSYAVEYSNNTQWLSTSISCDTHTTSNFNSIASTTYSTYTVVTISQIPCGSPTAEWYPVNGTVITPNLRINFIEAQLAIQPTSISAHSTQQIQVTVSIDMHAGVYAINLGMDIQTPSSRPVQYLLGYTPLIVQG